MNIQTNQNKILSMLLILLSLFIFVIFTKDSYSELLINMNAHEESDILYNSTKEELNILSKRSKELKWSGSWAETAKYLKWLKEDEIIRELYWYVEESSKNWELKLLSTTFNKWSKNEMGFNEVTIQVNVRVPNMKALSSFLDFIVDNEDYKFFVTQLSLPRETNKKFNIQIPITYFYKEI